MCSSSKIIAIKAIDMKEENYLSTGSAQLDQLLNGGLPNEGIVEITGESGCGKSQLCMQLSLTVQYPVEHGGFGGGVVYICTEERFPSKRLHQLIQNFPKQYYRHNGRHISFGDNILIVHVSDFGNLAQCLKKVPSIVQSKNVKLIVVDSITAVFRGNYAAHEAHKKVIELRYIGNMLHKLSAHHKLLVVCVNQVSQSLTDNRTVPALGLAWANLVTTRILITRNGGTRHMQVVYSPHLPSKLAADFTIETSGIV